MIYLFCGSDNQKVRTKSQSVLAHLKNKRPEVAVYPFDSDSFDFEGVRTLLDQQSLFEGKYVLSWHNLLTGQKTTASFQADLTDLLGLAQKSDHIILWQEGELIDKQKKEVSKFCEKVEEFDLKSVTKENNFAGAFLLVDYLGENKKQEAWIYLNELFQKGMVADELTGALLYFMKTLALVGSLSGSETADLKPFVLSKYKKFAKNYSVEIIQKKYEQLLEVIAESRTIAVPLASKLEGWVLGW